MFVNGAAPFADSPQCRQTKERRSSHIVQNQIFFSLVIHIDRLLNKIIWSWRQSPSVSRWVTIEECINSIMGWGWKDIRECYVSGLCKIAFKNCWVLVQYFCISRKFFVLLTKFYGVKLDWCIWILIGCYEHPYYDRAKQYAQIQWTKLAIRQINID